jgi:uncharacterized protein YcbK (DUF882 family)
MISDWLRYPNFEEDEFRCKCGCGLADMDDGFINWLQEMRIVAGFPFSVSSGFRCPKYNSIVSRTGPHGPHTTGKASDILVFGRQARKIDKLSHDFYMTGIGLKQHGPLRDRFIHLDNLLDSETEGPRPWIWSYS